MACFLIYDLDWRSAIEELCTEPAGTVFYEASFDIGGYAGVVGVIV
jgi:hypothetical protein